MSLLGDRIEKAWDPLKHPRDEDGRFLGDGLEVDVGTMTSPPLPALPYKAPPPNRPAVGGGKGFTSFGLTNTEFGDAVEKALIEQMGMQNLHPGQRQGPLDLALAQYGFEVKAVTTAAKEYKAKPKKHEVEAKRREAERRGLKPGMMIVVVDELGIGHVYWKDGIGAYRVSQNMNYAGTVKVRI